MKSYTKHPKMLSSSCIINYIQNFWIITQFYIHTCKIISEVKETTCKSADGKQPFVEGYSYTLLINFLSTRNLRSAGDESLEEEGKRKKRDGGRGGWGI